MSHLGELMRRLHEETFYGLQVEELLIYDSLVKTVDPRGAI